jgi:hypothetical protein
MYDIYVYACVERQTVSYGMPHLHEAIEEERLYFTISFYALLSLRRKRAGEAGKESGKVGRK